ncbi:histidine kinase [Cohnella xylanilytica]|uniref:cache domain-containing sensor histidine kinase n=1 Tax=Cohnella xylanilytica TaxID=557555 RepID=UPI001B116018|nr:sensor histidine kinase [Cohnella xylanilytica]GIO12579.1 histidine kinase [Cohnella xylanilytica]
MRRRPFQFKSIHTSIALAFSLLILGTTLLLSYSSYRQSASFVADTSVEYTTTLIEQVNANIRTYVDNMESISALAIGNGDLTKFLSAPLGTPESEQLKARIGRFFHSVVASRTDIATLAFAGSNGAVISDREGAKLKDYTELIGQDWYREARAAKGEVVLSSSRVQHLYPKEYRWVISLSRELSGEGRLDPSGVLLVDLNYNLIDDLCRQIQLGSRGYVFIVDSAGDLIYHPQQQIMFTELKTEDIPLILRSPDTTLTVQDGKEPKKYTIRSTDFGWKIVGVTYPKELVGDKAKMQLSAALWGGLCLVIALGLSVLLSFTMARPLKRLDAHMKQVEKGNFDIRVDVTSTNEIGKLARTFNLMIAKIRELMNQKLRDEEIKRTSEIKALQAQIQPHFLYNTLDSIIWMAETNKMAEVVKMTTALSRLFRSSIGQGEEEVPLSVELEHVGNYLTIQSMRYRNRFVHRIDVPEELRDARIQRVILQPLVENAIYHGMRNKAETGEIVVSGRLAGSLLELTVADDGAGMTPEQVRTILSERKASESGTGMGVLNVHRRIQLFYGPQYGLEYRSEREEGTVVTLRVPWRKGGEDT